MSTGKIVQEYAGVTNACDGLHPPGGGGVGSTLLESLSLHATRLAKERSLEERDEVVIDHRTRDKILRYLFHSYTMLLCDQ